MIIEPVNSPAAIRAFLEVPKELYKSDPNWTCPLDAEIEGTFNPSGNSCFEHGEAKRWILYSEEKKLIGRIAAFYDNRKKDHSYVTSGCIGFFECIHNQESANLLFDTAKEWLQSKGMKAMDGSCNFGENLFNWGVLTYGFFPQGVGMPYNFPYYKELFENYGFKDYFQQLSYRKDLSVPWPERQYKFAEYLSSRPEYKFVHFRKAEMDKYLHDFVATYNAIWSDFHEEYTPMTYEDIHKLFKDMEMLIDEQLIWFAYAQGKPIGFCVGLPDINIVLRKLKNGKLDLINKLKLLYHLKINRKAMNRCRVVISGVVPEYQQKGIIGVLFLMLIKNITFRGFKELDLAWTGDYNKPVLTIYEQVGASHATTHTTFRYLFDRSAEFQRFTNIKGYKSRKRPVA